VRCRRARRLLIAAALAGSLLLSAAARAEGLEFRPCAGTPDYECAKLQVALDPSAPGGELLSLEVRRLTETREGRGVLVALAGGPGQSATEFIDDFASVLAEGLVDRQLIVVDQRGTGRSGPLSCPALDGGPELLSPSALTARAGLCAQQLGPRRRFYTTTEVVEDLEVLRRALGPERMSLFGVSYGAYVAQRYARRFPDRIDGLVLDSPVAQDQGGPFDRPTYAAVGRVLRALCAHRRCPGVTDPVTDVSRLRARLPLRGAYFDPRGRRRSVRLVREGELFDLLVSSDFSPALRGALPAAIHAAVRGDGAPLLRLVAADREQPDPRQPDERNDTADEFSNALFFTTTCQEKPLPWGSPEAAPANRAARRAAALDALGPSALAPFGRGAAASTQVGTAFCLAWPPTPVPAVPAPGTVDAQALVLSGATDLHTPSEEAERTAAAIRDATLVRVPAAGHAVVSQSLPCVQRALARFFSETAVGNPCDGRRRPATTWAPVPPTGLGTAPRRGVRGPGATVAAATLATIEDTIRTAAIPGELGAPSLAGGLRGGNACARPGPRGSGGRRALLLKLRGVRYVPGLAVSGSATVVADRLRSLKLTLRGARGRRGRVELAGRQLRGRLGSRRVGVTLAAARTRMPALTVPAALDAGARPGCS
jgi:pimeloyl-ACP methyl ester carboxylesterase